MYNQAIVLYYSLVFDMLNFNKVKYFYLEVFQCFFNEEYWAFIVQYFVFLLFDSGVYEDVDWVVNIVFYFDILVDVWMELQCICC